jgi:hypothetical protein
MAAALERPAGCRSASSIEDPVAWQCEIRKDRQLPDRERSRLGPTWSPSTSGAELELGGPRGCPLDI